MNHSRNRLPLKNLLNARDLGGLRTQGGQRTRYGRFIRSDEPSLLDHEDITSLLQYPVTMVIDLRDDLEVQRRSTPFIRHKDILYRNISLFGSDADDVESEVVKIAISQGLGNLYVYVLENRRDFLAEIFREMLAAPPGAVLFHCTHGKDRTGIIAALLLLLADVERSSILENYSATYDFIRPIVDPKMKKLPEHMQHILRSDRENMEIMLSHIDRNYDGKANSYFEHIGLSSQEIATLRFQLLDRDDDIDSFV